MQKINVESTSRLHDLFTCLQMSAPACPS